MRVLLIKMSALGDILHVFPVVSYIKASFPQATIDWVVEDAFAELVKAHPFVDGVIRAKVKKWKKNLFKKDAWKEISSFTKELRKNKYDLVLDLQGNVKSGIITALSRSSDKVGFGYQTVSEWPNILTTHRRYNPNSHQNIREDYVSLAKEALRASSNFKDVLMTLSLSELEKDSFSTLLSFIQHLPSQTTKVMICAGSNWSNKKLSDVDLQKFLKLFSDKEEVYFFWIWGNREEKISAEQNQALLNSKGRVLNKMPFPVLQWVMKNMDLVLSMDSLPLHLAALSGVPTYSFFGASSAKKYGPIGEQHHAFQGTCPYGQRFEKRCALLRTCKTGACIKQVEIQNIFEDFYQWWCKRKNHLNISRSR